MANKRQRKRKKPRVREPVELRATAPAVLRDVSPPKSKIVQTGERLLNSAVNTALDKFWTLLFALVAGAVGPTVTATVVAIVFYLRSPASAWAYALLKYSLVFLAGTAWPIAILIALALLGIYRRKKKEKDRVHKYASKDKAWIDYAAELEPVFAKFIGLLMQIGGETAKVAVRSAELIEAVQIPNPQQRKAVTSRRAKTLNKHCLKMELAAEQLAEARDAFFEVSEGLLKTAPDASQGNGPKLRELQEALNVMNDSAIDVIQTQKGLIENSKAAYGAASMDVNTSLNWLIAVCEENVRIIEVFESRMSRNLLPLIETKLRA